MRILIAAQSYMPPANGVAVFSIHLAEGLARAGHQVMAVAPANGVWPDRAWHNGVLVRGVFAVPLVPFHPEVHVTPLPGLEVGRLVGDFRPDVVQIQDHYPLSRGVLRAAQKRHLTLVGGNFFLPENLIPHLPAWLRSRESLVERVVWKTVLDVMNRVEVVTTPTETGAAILRRQGIRVPVRAISCGIDLGHFRPDAGVDRAAVRLRYRLDPGRTLFLYVGRVDREKRVDVLVNALHLLGRDDLQLAIAGHGNEAKALQALVQRLGLARQVVFTGYVPEADMIALLNSADVFAMPSDAELQSIATLEAMGTGRPVLAADAKALPELVENGVNGYLFRAGDVQDAARRIVQLADRPENWAAMGAASLTMARPHDLENTIRHYEELYRSLRAKASRPEAARRAKIGTRNRHLTREG
jgi:1,2-diacylglycerol 3-alpha-glucosyltransferase